LSIAATLKRKEPNIDEELLIRRALRESTIPKLIGEDIALFTSILKDLFPDAEDLSADYDDLKISVNKTLKKFGLQSIPAFVMKCLQLYHTIEARSSVMLVGESFSGKSTCYKVLVDAINNLKQVKESYSNLKVDTYILNPKSITIEELYGFTDPALNWTDGILSHLIRELAADTSIAKKWVILDGPVDSFWIESMNTAMDSNKMLFLTNGERISINPTMKLIFEVPDLNAATPATVSRCGMVFMDNRALGWKPLMSTWLEGFSSDLLFLVPTIRGSMQILGSLFEFIKTKCKLPVPIPEPHMLRNLLNLLGCFLKGFEPYEAKHFWVPENHSLDYRQIVTVWGQQEPIMKEAISKLSVPQKKDVMECLFLFSLVWSIGAVIESSSRPLFDEYVRNALAERPSLPPQDGVLYDFYFDFQTYKWKKWIDHSYVKNYKLSLRDSWTDILIPTADNVSRMYLMDMLVHNKKPVMLYGNTATGKSLEITNLIFKALPKTCMPIKIVFSKTLTAREVQDYIETNIEGAPSGRHWGPISASKVVLFIDNMASPEPETF